MHAANIVLLIASGIGLVWSVLMGIGEPADVQQACTTAALLSASALAGLVIGVFFAPFFAWLIAIGLMIPVGYIRYKTYYDYWG